jgi:hypothetical protein
LTFTRLTFAAVSAVEVAAVEALVTWRPARYALLLGGVWSLFLVLGLWAATVVRPYVVDGRGVRIRQGLRGDLVVDAARIVAVRRRAVRDWRGGGLGADVVRGRQPDRVRGGR